MTVDDQSETIEFLSDPATYGLRRGRVEKIETHGAIVFLAGGHAYKLKRAVWFEYMDFSTVDRRRAACEAEVRINSRTAPEIYLGVLAIVREEPNDLTLTVPDSILKDSAVIDWVVKMVRFEGESLFDRLAERGNLTSDLMTALADRIVQFHEHAEIRLDMGGRTAQWAVIEANHRQFLHFSKILKDKELVESVTTAASQELERCGEEVERRRAAGLVRHCHGDMHLGNIVLFKGTPTLFDAIEFDEKIACVDVLHDLAFLLMDLTERRLKAFANQVFNHYLCQTAIPDVEQLSGLKCLPLFLSCRAGVRAHVNAAISVTSVDGGGREASAHRARTYLVAAARYLEPSPPRVIAVGGLSGVGKSALAKWLSPNLGRAPGALWVRSDVVRKRLLGKTLLENLGPDAYLSEVNERVYGVMHEMMTRALDAGHSVVIDAVFARESERRQLAEETRSVGVEFRGLWLAAPEVEMIRRIQGRHGDASDATVEVLMRQLKYDLGGLDWTTVDASGSEKQTRQAARDILDDWLNL